VSIEPGTVVAGRYRVQKLLGKGGMGEVFSAENTRTGRTVALKVLRSESKQKKSSIERFRREARAAGVIKSDFVTQVLDVEDDPEHGIVLVFELLEGESLVDRLKRTGPMPMSELWAVVEAVWMGLADAHAAGIVHRDLKPSNVFLEQNKSLAGPGGPPKVKILDFGISKLPKEISSESLTQVGQSLGTFSFMPPEQIGRAKNVDHRADIYAATTLVFQALSGKLPYQAKNVVAMMELKTKQDPRTLGEAMGAPQDARLEAFIAKGLARNPDARFQTALEALAAWRELKPKDAMPRGGQQAELADAAETWRRNPEEEARTLMMRKWQAPSEPPADGTTSAGDGQVPSGAFRSDAPGDEGSTTVSRKPGAPLPAAGMPPAQPQVSSHPPHVSSLPPAGGSSPGTSQPPSGPHGSSQPPSGSGSSAFSAMRPGGMAGAMTMPSPSPAGPTGTVPFPDPRYARAGGYPVPATQGAGQAGVAPARNGNVRTTVLMLLGAIGLMLLGFLAVALALRYLR
jgi:eukaryotic-like serine/threonine-protein kinase